MESAPKAPRRRSMSLSFSLTVAICLLTLPVSLPPLLWLPNVWRAGTAAVLLIILLVGPGRPYWLSLFCKPSRLPDQPLRLVSAAVVLLLITSAWMCFRFIDYHDVTPLTALHFHSISLIISIDLVIRALLSADKDKEHHMLEEELHLGSKLVAHLEAAEADTAPLITRSREQAKYLYIVMIVIAVVTLALWIGLAQQPIKGLTHAATVLLVCAPWIWLYALPQSFSRGILEAARHQVVLRSAGLMELATRLNAVVFGKRGTLTRGFPRVTDVLPMSGIDEEELLLWGASAEHNSRHPFGQAVVREAENQSIPLEPPERFTEMSGRGVQCIIDNQQVRFGKPAFFEHQKLPPFLADRLEVLAQEGKTPFLCVRGDDQYLGIIAVAEELRREAAATIEKIRRLGLQTILMTGDDRTMSEAIAQGLHIDKVVAEILPADKIRELNRLRREGFQLAMVGTYPDNKDLFNESEMSIAMGRAGGADIPPTDVILLENQLGEVVKFFDLSGRVVRIARQNRAFALIYHGIAGLLAAGVLDVLGYAPIAPVAGIMLSGSASLLTLLNNRRIENVITT